MQLSETNVYQNILSDLQWLDKNVILDPQDFAEDYLREIAATLSTLVGMVDDGEI